MHLVRRHARTVQCIVVALTLVFLVRQAANIGWSNVWATAPASPLFALTFLAWYFLLPVVDTFLHGYLWRKNLWPHVLVFAMKKVYNFAVFSFVGETYVFGWARNTLGLDDKKAFSVIKDIGILSGAASNALCILMVAAAAFSLHTETLSPSLQEAVLAGVAFGALTLAGVAFLRKRILGLSAGDTLRILLAHMARNIAQLALQALLWQLAAPDVDFTVWLQYLALYMVLTRLPFLPNKDLVFAGVGAGLASLTAAPEHTIASVIIVTGALTQLAHLAVFSTWSIARLRHGDLARSTPG